MKHIFRVASAVCLLTFVALLLSPITKAQAPRLIISASQLQPSPSTIVSLAIRAGILQLRSSAPLGFVPQVLTCSPSPCVLPAVQASEGGNPVNETPIAANPNNAQQLLAGANDYNCSNLLGFYTSSNGGSTWVHTCMNAVAGTVGLGDPAVGYDLNNTAYIAGINGSGGIPQVIAFEKSTDNGTTWSLPQIAVRPAFSSGQIDKPWLAIDTNATSPFVNSLYISATNFSKGSPSQDRISVSRSENAGASWQTTFPGVIQTAPDEDQFSDLAVGKDGTVYVTWLHCTQKAGECAGTVATMFFAKSTDGGNTWSPPTIIATPTIAPHLGSCNPSNLCNDGELPNTSEPAINEPSISVDNSAGSHKGNLYVAMYNYAGIPTHMTVEVVTSVDGGLTWGTPVPVAPSSDTHDQFFPWLSVNSSGVVGVTWLDRRNDPANISYQPFAAVSTNGGTSFGKNFVLKKLLSNPNNDGLGGFFMGDYSGNSWVRKKLYASWMDSSNGIDMQDNVGGFFY